MPLPKGRFFSLVFSSILTVVSLVLPQSKHHCTVSGKVVDDSTSAPLQNVDVFIAHTTLGCGTDKDGQFEIQNVPAGSYQLVASRVGYSLHSVQIIISGEGKKVFQIRLRPTTIQVGEIIVTAPDPSEWRDQLRKFIGLFVGRTRNAEKCRIVNPEVLDFDESRGVFSATARAPLEIQNEALGYHLRFYLTLFKFENNYLTYEGLPKYTQMQYTIVEDGLRWRRNRERAYQGSLRHFLVSLMKGVPEDDGYSIYLLRDVTVKASASGSKSENEDSSYVFGQSLDMRGEVSIRLGKIAERIPIPNDSLYLIISGSPRHYVRNLHPNGVLEVEFNREPVEPGYDFLRKEGTDAQVSWLVLNYRSIAINARGMTREFFPTRAYGYWAWERLADMLPLDFDPDEK